jgi:hypothetical protein
MAESQQAIPDHLLAAIARVESGRPDPASGAVRPWPWTIDIGGDGQFFDSESQAIAQVQRLQARGLRSIDVGCMQVNLMHHPDAFMSLQEAFQPYANAMYAARFLRKLYGLTHDWTQAAALYHSATPALAAAYRARVLEAWPVERKLGTASLLPLHPIIGRDGLIEPSRTLRPSRTGYRSAAR